MSKKGRVVRISENGCGKEKVGGFEMKRTKVFFMKQIPGDSSPHMIVSIESHSCN